jgi:uncharacterized membrane protein
VNRILRYVTYIIAIVYFLVDAVFITIAKPMADWLAQRFIFDRLRNWIKSLRPYPALALFGVPVIILEPVKLVAVYLAATGHITLSIVVLVIGELLKLILFERLFSLTRENLLSIPAFNWAYCRFRQADKWLKSSEVWRSVRRLSKIATCAARTYAAELKSLGPIRRVSRQSR